MKVLNVRHARTADNRPLAIVDLPGPGAEMTPVQMRGLARALLDAADECASRPTDRDYRPASREYPFRTEKALHGND
ncbi:hypothetical protein [uncultured Desulfosarcina sp.]|uniref:hypothetical protein n=1 Tax=uncultured Desulfosarcina sp. TaxID=218289 RepID=UPI0029C8F590|nr:hypothetical protein [uncultured Desulfosarcina sp.]